MHLLQATDITKRFLGVAARELPTGSFCGKEPFS
jgi:hypothetical protein